MDMSLRRFALVGLLLAVSPHVLADQAPKTPMAAATSGYLTPPAPLQALVDAPRPPQLSISPHRDLLALTQTPPLPGIDVVAQPELKLAGLRINPRTYAQSRFVFSTDLWLMDVASGKEIRLQGLPQPLSIATSSWSPDQRYLAFNQVNAREGTNELWVVDVAARSARRLIALPLNTVAGRGYRWMPDGKQLLLQLQPQGQGSAPVASIIPTGPDTQQTQAGGGVKAIRTYQDMLRNEDDAKLFEYYLRSQSALVDLDGKVTPLGEPSLTIAIAPSPDGRYLLRQRVERPFSYLVPVDSFPRRIEVLDRDGKLVKEIAHLPLLEGLPTGNDAVATGVRDISWRADAPATLVWAEAQDGGDPARKVDIRDIVQMQAAPFDQSPVTLAKLGSRYGGVYWANGGLALVEEFWWKTRQVKEWRVSPDQPSQAPVLVREGSSEDRYRDPGTPATMLDEHGEQRLIVTTDGQSIYRLGEGASPQGDRPFIDRVSLQSGQSTRLFQSQAPYYEDPQVLLDAEGTRALISRESPTEPTNFYVRELASNGKLRELTHFPNPLPQLKGVKKEQIRYKRKDGVELTATLYLPPNYDPKKDGPRPMLMWAYPAEFKSADAAGQVKDSPYKFNRISYWGPQAFLTMGYTVLDNFSVPIVGEGDKEPNDTYIPQLVASAEAAVDEVVRRGVADRNRIAVGGHSYGAFMTANLLAHTRLFKAGIARSGAYNRTLTPFGFQAEERNYWQAPDVYNAMAPFNYADHIKDALLMIHGEQDNNSGTFPIQSERMYAAVKGLGGTARLVLLPNEAHAYRARESIMQMLAEMNNWLETYVKQAKPAEKATASH
ncbi:MULTISPECIES: prolyl oligopeptidase family serine peptidase [unclassified Dyella]|uniref:S9 family peptidase n=1 Tax=unclassified Dyella TaxID=2634549 RepID=UPI000C840FBE|nr:MULTISPECIES: prolyl oligopeptidase family serine peptidase [unclassified Dyella]MDR3444964.1 prolyl oligopeptidase family serine peptidase [Dyella sp.]PMQ05080.1 Prolyl tripeptidyl peptidase [Dyella sp. AD56]